MYFLQVAQLEMQLAAAERCSAELREINTALGSGRQEDVEVLRVSWQGTHNRLLCCIYI